MFRKPTGSKPAPRASSTTAKVETPPTARAHQAEPGRVEQKAVPVTPGPSGADRSPSRDQIAVDAYHRWVARGMPFGTDLEDWLEAERRLSATA